MGTKPRDTDAGPPAPNDLTKSPVFLQQLQISGLLSFARESEPIPFRALNVLIGANGSGKSNILEAIQLLASSATSFDETIRAGGGMRAWMHRPLQSASASEEGSLEAVLQPKLSVSPALRHRLTFRPVATGFALDESLEEAENTRPNLPTPYSFFRTRNGLVTQDSGRTPSMRGFDPDEFDGTRSVVSQRNDPYSYSQQAYLLERYRRFQFFRDWTFGRRNAARSAQSLSSDSRELASDTSNLGLVLNRIRTSYESKRRLLHELQNVVASATDVHIEIAFGQFQLSLEERDRLTPAPRLSDGTLRYLSLLCLLLDPSPSAVLVLEEPELGLHPDAIRSIAKLLKEASRHRQIFVTTHSTLLVDCFSETPEDVVVVEAEEGESVITRLDEPKMKEWLGMFGGSLSSLWMSGKIGGTRW